MQFNMRDQSVLVIEDLTERGFASKDWFKYKLNHSEVLLALTELAKFHACGLAYRMSLKEEIDEKYPYLEDDLYTSNMTKELLAKYLDSYLHFLTYLDPSIQVRKYACLVMKNVDETWNCFDGKNLIHYFMKLEVGKKAKSLLLAYFHPLSRNTCIKYIY